jgi:hypothetical protein
MEIPGSIIEDKDPVEHLTLIGLYKLAMAQFA